MKVMDVTREQPPMKKLFSETLRVAKSTRARTKDNGEWQRAGKRACSIHTVPKPQKKPARPDALIIKAKSEMTTAQELRRLKEDEELKDQNSQNSDESPTCYVIL